MQGLGLGETDQYQLEDSISENLHVKIYNPEM